MPILDKHEGITMTGLLPSVNYNKEDFFDKQNSKFRFARGFLLCKDPDITLNKHFTKISFYEYCLYYHELVKPDIAKSDDNDISVILMGTAYFTNIQYVDDNKTEAVILLEKLIESDESFYEALDYLAGRYVIICKKREKYFAVNDPCGLKTVFYCPDSQTIGSHLELVNLIAHKGISEIEKTSQEKAYKYMYAYVGNLTKYENIKMIIPNFSLSLGNYEMTRFFPRKQRKTSENVYDVKNRYYKLMDFSVMQLLKKRKKLCLSLTAGSDSRVSFYSTKQHKDKIFFYTEARDNDIEGAKKIAIEEKLNWVGVDSKDLILNDNPYEKAYKAILIKNIFPESAKLALATNFWQMNMYGLNDDYIAIHSNCAEAGRGRLDSYIEFSHFKSDEYCFENFMKCYDESTYALLAQDIKDKQHNAMSQDNFLKNELKNFFDKLDLENTVAKLGYNPWDFMYIEQRTAFFLGQIHMYNDAIMDSVSLTCSREVLTLMWELPNEFITPICVLYNCILNEKNPDRHQLIMGKNFIPNGKEANNENYHLVYDGSGIEQLLEKDEQKIDLCKKVISINHTIKWAHTDLLQLYLKNQMWQSAVDEYTAIIDYDISLINWGEIVCNKLRNSGNIELAAQVATTAIEFNRNTAWAYKQLSHVASAKGNRIEAEVLAERSFSINKSDRYISENYIRCILNNKKYEKAKNILNSTQSKYGKTFWHILCMALYYECVNKIEDAKKYAERAKSILPDDANLNNLIARLSTK